MNDRELLELAAKAAGLRWNHYIAEERATRGLISLWLISGDGIGHTAWNPLLNNGDALWLAVKLKIEIDHNHPADQTLWVSACALGLVPCVVEEFEDESQRLEATRRAIVIAAAEIGRQMT